MISFTYALVIFFAILTSVYLALLLWDYKTGGSRKGLLNPKGLNIVVFTAFALMGLLLFFTYFMDTSILYLLLYPVIVFLILIAVIRSSESNKTRLLILAILLHLTVLSAVFPHSGIMLTERTPALLELDKANSWDPEWELINPYYDPFPMDLGLSYAFSEITGIDYLTLLSNWIITLFFIIAFDSIIFSLGKELGGTWKAGILGVLILAFTPTAHLNIQPQFIANFFVFVFILALFKSLKYSPSISSVILINFTYAISILVHGTTAIGLCFTGFLFLFMLFGRKFGLNIATTTRHRSFVYTVLISVCVITLARWVLVGGVEPVIIPLQGMINDLFGAQKLTWIGTEYVPLYDQFVSPIIAYAWTVPISLGAGFVLYHLAKRSQKKSLKDVFASSLSIAAAVLALAGFVGGVFMAHGNLQRYLGYAGMTLFLPVAAIACTKILKSPSKKIVSIGLISIVLFSGIAIFDPAFSRQLYTDLETVNPTSSADLIEANTLFGVLSSRTSIVSTYEIITAFSYLNLLSESSDKIRLYAGSLKVHRIYAENLTTTKEAIPDVTYILKPKVLTSLADAPVNVIYNSGRHVAVEGAK